MALFHHQVAIFVLIIIIGAELQGRLVDGLIPNKLNPVSDAVNDEEQSLEPPMGGGVFEAAKGSPSKPQHRSLILGVGSISLAGIIRMILDFFHLLLTPPTPPSPTEPAPTYPQPVPTHPYTPPVPPSYPSPTVPITYIPPVPPPVPMWPSPIVPITYTPPTYPPPVPAPPTYRLKE